MQRKLAFAAWSTSSDKELKVSNLLLDATSNNKAYGKSLAPTEHKDTISDEDKQRLGNFVLCLRNARFDRVCFGSMAEEAQVELCVVFNWHQGDFCKFSWKTYFEPVLASCVMNINEVCMDWFYGIYKPANQIYGDLQTSRISMGSNGTRKIQTSIKNIIWFTGYTRSCLITARDLF